MNYGVFTAGTTDLVCMGNEEQCAEALGATKEQFLHWVKNPDAGYREGISIYKIESEKSLQSPCDTCPKAPPKPKGAVSASCNDVHCAKQEDWERRYWKSLHKRFWERK